MKQVETEFLSQASCHIVPSLSVAPRGLGRLTDASSSPKVALEALTGAVFLRVEPAHQLRRLTRVLTCIQIPEAPTRPTA